MPPIFGEMFGGTFSLLRTRLLCQVIDTLWPVLSSWHWKLIRDAKVFETCHSSSSPTPAVVRTKVLVMDWPVHCPRAWTTDSKFLMLFSGIVYIYHSSFHSHVDTIWVDITVIVIVSFMSPVGLPGHYFHWKWYNLPDGVGWLKCWQGSADFFLFCFVLLLFFVKVLVL